MSMNSLNLRTTVRRLGFLALCALSSSAAWGVPELGYVRVNLNYDSGNHDGPHGGEPVRVWQRDVTVGAAVGSWLRLYFRGYYLGAGSYVRVVNRVEPAAVQSLNGQAMAEWHSESAYFNGHQLRVELWAAAGDRGVFVTIDQAVYGTIAVNGDGLTGICNRADIRVAGTRAAVGRVMSDDPDDPCTAFIVTNGALVTAGHCYVHGGLGVVQFNVPASRANGLPQHPAPRDQYVVELGSVNFSYGDDRPDWAVFAVYANTETGERPLDSQGDWLDPLVVDDLPLYRAQIYGFGKATQGQHDYDPVTPLTLNFGAKVNVHDFVGQENLGDLGAPNWVITYTAVGSSSTSGAPVLLSNSRDVVGIHVAGTCQIPLIHANMATSFRNQGLLDAVQVFDDP